MSLRTSRLALAGIMLVGLAPLAPAHAQQTAYAIANGGTSLIRFATNDPTGATLVGNFSGGDTFLDAIAFRPSTGQLYGFKSNLGSPFTTVDSLYTINLTTAALTLVGTAGMTTNTNILGAGFNPGNDSLRVITDSTQNLVFNPNDGSLQTVGTLLSGPAVPHIIALAYSGSTGTEYGIDYGADTLDTIAGDAGTLTTVGALGVDTDLFTGFDIFTDASSVDSAYAILNTDPSGNGGAPGLYTLNLGTGAATSVGAIGGGFTQVYSLAITPVASTVPEPGSLALLVGMGLTGVGFLARRRKNARQAT